MLMAKNPNSLPPPSGQVFCNLLNITQCSITETATEFSMTVYNPIGRPVQKYIRLPVTEKGYVVTDHKGEKIDTQVDSFLKLSFLKKQRFVVIIPIPEVVMAIPGRKSDATSELIFRVDLPALGFATYHIESSKEIKGHSSSMKDIKLGEETFSIENEVVSITFDAKTGLVKSLENSIDKSKIDLKQSFFWYYGMRGNNRLTTLRASGAYIFRPNGTQPYEFEETIEVKLIKGPLVEEVHQIFSPWVSQVIRLYKGEDHAEFEWLVGPIPNMDKIGKEVISRFDTNMESGPSFYTDSNGREILQRVRDKRPDYTISGGEPVAVNYYPVNSRIFIKDKSTQLTILTDRSQAGASIYQGSMELMVHRRLLYDDGFGVDEPLNEVAYGVGVVARGIHYVQLSKVESANVLHRKLGQQLFMSPWISFSESKSDESNKKKQFSGLKKTLPSNVHLLTLEKWTAGTILIRLEHFFEKVDDPKGSIKTSARFSKGKRFKINFSLCFVLNLFNTFDVVDGTEMSLDGVHPLSEMKRLKWKTSDSSTQNNAIFSFCVCYFTGETEETLDLDNILLNPMQIRTFTLRTSKKF
ncbi:Lysosomal alpha-mannosidase [Nymphon striatum]|nr:Lysosomal alpha-mannosidase [Nymphon striatum]KAG1649696.1 Lysosomal alpha-mannosidase [Nymphon striatum]